jgi:hypothetical protein
MPFTRVFAAIALLSLAACGGAENLNAKPDPIGDFRMGHNVVVGETAKQVPPTRAATAEEWEASFEEAIAARMGRYDGEGLYHLGVSVDAYALAIPGVPVVVKPRSVLVFTVTVWDNATRTKLNPEPKQITVLEGGGFSEASIIGSGLVRKKDEQMRLLSANGARAIERWLKKNEAWFDGDPTTMPPPEEDPFEENDS